jgi:hypothetical protein
MHHLVDIGVDGRFLFIRQTGRGGNHAPVLDGDIDAVLQVMTPASTTNPAAIANTALSGERTFSVELRSSDMPLI